MKQLLFGVVLGATLAFSAGVALAYANVKTIYSLENQKPNSVSVFDDQKNKCYVTKGSAYAGYSYDISCVRKD